MDKIELKGYKYYFYNGFYRFQKSGRIDYFSKNDWTWHLVKLSQFAIDLITSQPDLTDEELPEIAKRADSTDEPDW